MPKITLVNPGKAPKKTTTYCCEVGVSIVLTLNVPSNSSKQAAEVAWDFVPWSRPLSSFDELLVEVQKPE